MGSFLQKRYPSVMNAVAAASAPGLPKGNPFEITPAGSSSDGLTSKEAEGLLAKVGPNSMPDATPHPLRPPFLSS
jgi:hypothetical protein